MRKTAAAAAMAASLTIGGGAGAVLFAPNLVGAQTDDTGTDDTGTDDTGTDDAGNEESGRPEPGTFLSEALAPLVEDGTIDQGQSDAVVEAIQDAKPDSFGKGPRGRGHIAHVGGEAVTDLLGIDAAELRALISDGQTLAEIGEANGVSVDQLVDALLSEVTERLDAAVEGEHLTADEAADKLAEATERAEDRINGELDGEFDGEFEGRRGRGGFGPGGNGPADAPGDDGDETTGS